MAVEFKIEFDKQQLKALESLADELPKRTKSKVMRKALTKGAAVIRKAARSNVGSWTIKTKSGYVLKSNMFKKAIKTQIRRGKSDGQLYAVIGAFGQKGGDMGPSDLSHWVEFGTLRHRSEPLRQRRSQAAEKLAQQGLGFKKRAPMRKALFSHGQEAQSVLGHHMIEGIIKQVDLIFKRGKL